MITERGLIIHFTNVASFEEDLSDRVRDRMKIWFKPIMLFRDDEKKVVTEGYPDLGVDGIMECPVEGLMCRCCLTKS